MILFTRILKTSVENSCRQARRIISNPSTGWDINLATIRSVSVVNCSHQMPLVTVSHLTKKFRTHTAVDDLSFSVNEGDVYGFLGQNGAGKSTTIRMLLTLISPTNGHIELFGLDLKKNRKKILSQVGAVIEKPDLYKYLSAFENLSLFARMSGSNISKKEITTQLEMVGLGERMHDKVKTFSQGMR